MQNTIDPNSPIPRYYQIYSSLRGRIKSNEFRVGDPLPSERQLVLDYGVSRITVVKALDILEKEGLIERQHGRGNFVTQPDKLKEASQRVKIAFIVPHILDSFIMAILNGVISIAHQNEIYVQVVSAFSADDEEAIIKLHRRILESLGYRVTALTDSTEALKLFEMNPGAFDLLISDMAMPKMNGAELISQVFRIRPNMPTILCTGFSEIMNEEKAKALGTRHFVMKPILRDEIAEVIRRTLDET